MPISSASIYRNISTESYFKMNACIDEGKFPKDDRSDRHTIKYDANLNAFRQSMIVIVFTGMWLEETLYQAIVSSTGLDIGKKNDFKTYQDWLVRLDIFETSLLDDVDEFMSTRALLMHTTNIDHNEILLAQTAAEHAQKIIGSISHVLGL